MSFATTGTRGHLRTLLLLGRVSNLPTVWSNCLAGWLLGGGGLLSHFLFLCLGATSLYVGGMFLNDAFDVEFDRQYRKERPIPSGAISQKEVWLWGLGLLGLGAVCLFFLGSATAILTLVLVGLILLYDAVHKIITFSPFLMAACRFFLYLVAASTAKEGVTGLVMWSGLALAAYIVGLSYLARKEGKRGVLQYWPGYLLGAPILLALIVNGGEYQKRGIVLSIILAIWVARCLRFTYWSPDRNVGLTVSGLLAGIVIVDLLAIAGGATFIGLIFLLFFAAALVFQRFIPAT